MKGQGHFYSAKGTIRSIGKSLSEWKTLKWAQQPRPVGTEAMASVPCSLCVIPGLLKERFCVNLKEHYRVGKNNIFKITDLHKTYSLMMM